MASVKASAVLLLLGVVAGLACMQAGDSAGRATAPTPGRIVEYDAVRLPGLQCVADRVIAETDPRLGPAQRAGLWRRYGLQVSFEWLVPQTGFTYHELSVRPWSWLDRVTARVLRRTLPPRDLPRLMALLNDDTRLHWAAPDALLLVWDEPAGEPPSAAGADAPDATALPAGEYGVTLLDDQMRTFTGELADWASHPDWPEPLPDFEYYRLCAPVGSRVPWSRELADTAAFCERYPVLYGTGQARALAVYQAAGSPPLAPVTVCVADTGVFMNHPDLAGRLHPNAIDANYSSYSIAAPGDRAGAGTEVANREGAAAVGLPRPAIKGQPAAHGTCVAGIIARCTDGFNAGGGPVRILPASLKSDRTFAIVGTRIKSPISAFIKLVACLYEHYPVGSFTPDLAAAIQNLGDVRVVSTSASIPRTYFSDAQWRLVSNLANKGAGAILEDLRRNNRVYLFAAGNEAQGAPNKPGDLDSVLAVSATMAFDASKPWRYPPSGEGSNLGQKCVSAPGHGIITSTLYADPNLQYLPESEVPEPRAGAAIPRRTQNWSAQTNRFSATSSATPQVAALAALLLAQDPQLAYDVVISRIIDSTAGRLVQGDWGQAHGLVDYAAALGW